jgi:calcineurin-like phosphoesterase
MIGDLIGKPGRVAVEQLLAELREERGIDFVTANGENVAGGMGLTPRPRTRSCGRRRRHHVGNHIWDKREIYPYLEANDACCGRSTTAPTRSRARLGHLPGARRTDSR